MTSQTSAQSAENSIKSANDNIESVVNPVTETIGTTTKPAANFRAEINTNNKSLKECVWSAIKNYYAHVQGSSPADVYDMVMTQVEPPLLQATMEFTRQNQSKAAILLGLSRGTLRKKLKRYNMD
jgi:Fis family transcriptional regulator